MGHLYRVSWLINTLQAQNRPELEIDVYCHDTLEAREYWALQEIPAAFFSTSQFSPQNLGQADVLVVDWLDSNPSLIAELAKGNSRVVLLDDYGPAQ